MKHPGENGAQGFPIENLSVDAGASMTEANILIDQYLENTTSELASDAVINLIDFRRNDLFHWESLTDGSTFRVVATNQHAPGLLVAPPDANPGDRAYEEPLDIDELECGGYPKILRDWLRGNVIEVAERCTYVRRDTGEEIYET